MGVSKTSFAITQLNFRFEVFMLWFWEGPEPNKKVDDLSDQKIFDINLNVKEI